MEGKNLRNKKWFYFITVFTLPLILAGCTEKKENKKAEQSEEKQVYPWSYRGKTGPKYWGNLEESYKISDDGKKQSPIDIPEQSSVNVLEKEALKLYPNYFDIEKIDQTIRLLPIEIEGRETAELTFKEKVYLLKEISVHTPSEHKISGRSFAGEMQWLLQDEEGHIMMLSVLIKEGEKNYTFDEVEAILSKLKNEQKKKTKTVVSTLALLPRNRQFYSYSGSLTTPPTTEDVHWLVFSDPITLSEKQIQALRNTSGENNRPVQALNGRKISE